jgi:hypothetical protein
MVAMHSKLASDWELFVACVTRRTKEMKRLKRALFSRDAADCLTVEEHGSNSMAGGKAALGDRSDRIHAANNLPYYHESIRAADGAEVTSVGINHSIRN